MKLSKEFKVGILASMSGILLYFGFNFLKGSDFLSKTKKYYALYENIDGLQKSNPVIVNGFTVGRVSNIIILQEKDNKILVELDVEDGVVLGDSTIALLYNFDFLGSKAIELRIKTMNGVFNDGDTLYSELDGGITDIAQTQIANLGLTISRINDILLGMQGSGEEIKQTIIAFRGTLTRVNAAIDQNENKLSQTVESFKQLSEDLSKLGGQIGTFIDNANGTLSKVKNLELEETLDRFQDLAVTLNETLEKFNESEGTINKLMTDDSLYTNLNKVMVDMDSLLNHMNQYPKHFFAPLGKKHKKIVKQMEN